METVWINEVEVLGEVNPSEEDKFELHFDVTGANNFHLFTHMLNDGTVHIRVPSIGHDFTARTFGHSSSYHDTLNQNTVVHFVVTYKEVSNDEETDSGDQDDEWTIFTGLYQSSIMHWCRIRAIAELLEEKGIIEKGVYEDRIRMVHERDFEEMQRFILEGTTRDQE